MFIKSSSTPSGGALSAGAMIRHDRRARALSSNQKNAAASTVQRLSTRQTGCRRGARSLTRCEATRRLQQGPRGRPRRLHRETKATTLVGWCERTRVGSSSRGCSWRRSEQRNGRRSVWAISAPYRLRWPPHCALLVPRATASTQQQALKVALGSVTSQQLQKKNLGCAFQMQRR